MGQSRSLFIFLGTFLVSPFLNAEPLKTVFNPFTGKPDYITRIDSNTVTGTGTCTSTSNSNGTVSFTCAGGSGGASALGVGTGTVSGFGWMASSPTSGENFNGAQFSAQLTGSATAFISLNQSSVTLQGNSISLAALSSSMTAVDIATGTLNTSISAISSNLHFNGHSTFAGIGAPSSSANDPNECFGYGCLAALTTGSDNTCVGYICEERLTTGTNNVAFGQGAGDDLMTGSGNTCLGANNGSWQPCQNLTSGSSNTYVGAGTGYITENPGDSGNTFIGFSAGPAGTPPANFDVLIGHLAQIDSTGISAGSADSVVIGAFSQGHGSSSTIVGQGMVSSTTNVVGMGYGITFGSSNVIAFGSNFKANVQNAVFLGPMGSQGLTTYMSASTTTGNAYMGSARVGNLTPGKLVCSDGSDNIATCGAGVGTPASPSGSIQFNNSGSFGGSAGLTTTGSNDLSVGTGSNDGTFTVHIPNGDGDISIGNTASHSSINGLISFYGPRFFYYPNSVQTGYLDQTGFSVGYSNFIGGVNTNDIATMTVTGTMNMYDPGDAGIKAGGRVFLGGPGSFLFPGDSAALEFGPGASSNRDVSIHRTSGGLNLYAKGADKLILSATTVDMPGDILRLPTDLDFGLGSTAGNNVYRTNYVDVGSTSAVSGWDNANQIGFFWGNGSNYISAPFMQLQTTNGQLTVAYGITAGSETVKTLSVSTITLGNTQLTDSNYTTSGTMATFCETGDTLGSSCLLMQNRFGGAGGIFHNLSLNLSDMGFWPSVGPQANLRLEGQSTSWVDSSNVSGEFQFIMRSTTTFPIAMYSGEGKTGVLSSGGLTITYGVNAGSMTGAGLTTCGDSSHALNYSATTGLYGCQTLTGGGGGGASTLAVTTGTSSGFSGPPISSPTAVVLFDSRTTNGQLLSNSTYFFTLRPDSVTLQGVVTAASLGALTGNQTITLSGDSTGSGTTAITVTAAATQPNIAVLSNTNGITLTSSATFQSVIQSSTVYVSSASLVFDEYNNGNFGATPTIDWTKSNKQVGSINATITSQTWVHPKNAGSLQLRLKTTGLFTVAWPANVHWGTLGAPAITVVAGKKDIVSCFYSLLDDEYDCIGGGQAF
jgi:hypothetical protein